MRRLSMLAVLVLLAAAPAWSATPSITKLEARREPPSIVKSRVLGQLGDILHSFSPSQVAWTPVNPLDRMDFWTTPRAADTAGLCVYDDVHFTFRRLTPVQLGANTPVRVQGIEASPRYRPLRPPPSAYGESQDPNRAADDRTCAALTPGKINFYTAGNEDLAVEGAYLVRSIADSAARGPVPFKLSCRGVETQPPPDCAKLAASLSLETLDDVQSCEPAAGAPPTAKCWAIGDAGLQVTVRGEMSATRFAVSEVVLDFEVIIADQRLD